MTATAPATTARARLHGAVLVVDDDIGLQQSVCDILATTGIEATGVGSASAATSWCDGHQPDLVVLDQRLPDASGLQLAALLKARAPLVPVVLLTGYVSTDSAIAAVGLVDDYLTKPVPPDELIKVVQTRLEQYRLRVANHDLLDQLKNANSRLEVTVEERTVELRTARDEAMEASRLKSQFLANMSHEIRTPMNGVIGAADLLTTTELTYEQRGYVDILSASSHGLLAIINDVLDFAKIEAGRLELERSTFEVREIFDGVVRMLAPQASKKGVRLSLQVDRGLASSVVGDAGRLRQVVTNLVGNAVKFTDTGNVAVDVKVVTGPPDPIVIRCSVSDSGIGIAQQDVPRLFSEFSQVDPSNTRRFGGTGLGLAISDRLVRLMGGAIGYTPAAGGGSTFWFTVPFELPEKSGHLQSARDAIDTSSASAASTKAVVPTVLIVEDNEINAVILARMLTLLGYRSDIARSGADALEAVTRIGYTTILMDCQMPVMDGFTTTEKLRAEPSVGPRIPVIAITATATTEDQARCLASGMDDYLPKPIVMERLAAILERWAPILSG